MVIKRFRLFSIVIAIILAFSGFFLSSCGGSNDSDSGGDEGDKPLVGISVPNNPTGWVGAVQWTADKKAKELDLNYMLVTSENPNEQANKIDDLIAAGCKYIVLFPENDELAVAAQKVKDAGIPLIDFDRTLGDVTPDYYVAGNNEEMGVLGAEYIVEKLDNKGGNVVVMNIPNYGEIFNERVKGAKSVFSKEDNINIVGEYASDDGAPETVLPVMKDVLTKHKKIDAIYSTDDEMSMGILQAIKEAGRDDIKVITGGGGWKDYFNIMNDYPNIWVSSQTYAPYMMNNCLEIVQQLIDGETVPAETIIPPQNVDRENYKQYLEDNGITDEAPY
ncbi:MAG: substrate-binding domain-containing protein [Clostridiales Family XIII bacterium]|jgi:ribose transport system substrate-binding protein|nr:substrate-binding domain-containing protein [Clostridiales Family XIII bacterium]